VYILLYESLLSWYAGQRMANAHTHLYAVATLAGIAFINIASVVVLCAYLDFRWARELLLLGRAWPFSIAIAVGLLAAHLLLFRRRGSAPATGQAPPGTGRPVDRHGLCAALGRHLPVYQRSGFNASLRTLRCLCEPLACPTISTSTS
jgi:hypothetical protein